MPPLELAAAPPAPLVVALAPVPAALLDAAPPFDPGSVLGPAFPGVGCTAPISPAVVAP
jgi:hypothetical protein